MYVHCTKVFFLIFAPTYVNSSRQNRFKWCNLHDLNYIFLDNRVVTTQRRQILAFRFFNTLIFVILYCLK